ncbi:MAG: magnesium/cobalt transporter CorA [Candidatus Cloacimonetes bacterium]|nr:magnesium/cobalt transporter CorA [Candidatus Cloacimonadota bacterium]MCF7867335.1 magnesium/cobalt transporter CorA [Candidatus Cloacimonadota bacterium]MCF7882769.1 magnesium/cobalt transporter CorA [Candidatus Cloacimonadota bacterium]
MARFIKKQSRKTGLPPGTIVHVGSEPLPTKMEYIRYNADEIEKLDSTNMENYQDVPDSVDWVHIQGLKDVELINKIGNRLEIHPLLLEDIFNQEQRAKTEDLDEGVFVVLKYPCFINNDELVMEQISMIFKGNLVLSLQNTHLSIFDTLTERLFKATGRIRKMNADYLLYALCDLIIDRYFSVLEIIDDKIELMEEELITDPQKDILQNIYKMKRDIIQMKRAVWPMREAIAALNRTDNPIVHESTHIFIRDLYDHTIQVIDTVETFREMVGGLQDMYLTSISNKMNEVMKVLTIFAAIFIPLTFLAGVYGMNFHFMPELSWKWSYPIWWIITIIIGVGMLIIFKRKKWM